MAPQNSQYDLSKLLQIIKKETPTPIFLFLFYLILGVIISGSIIFFLQGLSGRYIGPILIMFWILLIGIFIIHLIIKSSEDKEKKTKSNRKKESKVVTDHINKKLKKQFKEKTGKYIGGDEVTIELAPKDEVKNFVLDKIKNKKTNVDVHYIKLKDEENRSKNTFNALLQIALKYYLIEIHKYLPVKISILLKLSYLEDSIDNKDFNHINNFDKIKKDMINQHSLSETELEKVDLLHQEGLLNGYYRDLIYWVARKDFPARRSRNEIENVFTWLTSQEKDEGDKILDSRLVRPSRTFNFPNSKFVYMRNPIKPTSSHFSRAKQHLESRGHLLILSIYPYLEERSFLEDLNTVIKLLEKEGHTQIKTLTGSKVDNYGELRDVRHVIIKNKNFDLTDF